MNVLTTAQVKDFNRDGFIIVRGNFSPEEISLLARASKEDKALDQAAIARDDGQGHPVRLTAWNHPGDGIYGMFARCRRIVDAVEQLLEDEVYHYHSKMILKDARTGGAWAWHQDYGYWYQNGCLYPDFVSVSTAVDRATKLNGCMQVLTASHKLGRVNHNLSGEQAGADLERVTEAKKHLPLVHCEMEPGDSLYFHANLLHCSAANESENPRWSLISCYNAKHNNPYKESHHPRYTPLAKVDDSEVLRVARERFQGNRDGGVVFGTFNTDNSAKSLAPS
ncbi:MAG: Ectoine hydroxylase-related dioxygenase [Verrucomicrobia bacterium]|jgi:ectoine hydroxylase|nr:MAG: Ectoine hydroxylase-related dioxygenase [Verrucomicrobiota bacterium]